MFDPLGWIGIVAVNHLHPPLNNPKLRRALLRAFNQQDYVDAAVGAVPEFGRVGAGIFTLGTPNATTAGMEVLMGKRDLDVARKLVAESGYAGEKVVIMSPSDLPVLEGMAQVTAGVLKSVGINVEYVSMDWGSLVTRRSNKEAPDKGGWNIFCTTWTGLTFINPGNHFPLRGAGTAGWFGWATDAKMESLRESWFEAKDAAEEKRICEQMQLLAWENVPFYPVGHWFYPTAFRDNLRDHPRSFLPVFWGVKRV